MKLKKLDEVKVNGKGNELRKDCYKIDEIIELKWFKSEV